MKKIKQSVLDIINNPASMNRLGLKLNCSAQAVLFQVRHNKINGRLTKMDALEAIADEAKISVHQILEDVVKTEDTAKEAQH